MNILIRFATLAIVVAFIGCADKTEYVNLENSKEYTSTGLDYHDIQDAAQKSIDSLISSKYAKKISSDKPKVLVISDVINDTMQHIDTAQLTRKITREMRNSGKFVLSLAMGASEDSMIHTARKARNNDEYNQYTTIEKGELIAPELSLSGKIIQKNTKISSGKQRIDYYFLLTLSDIKSGLVLWDDEVNIIKVGSNKNVAW